MSESLLPGITSSSPLRVLLLQEAPGMAEEIDDLLRQCGYQPTVIRVGDEASFRDSVAGHPELILLDPSGADLGPTEAQRIIRATSPAVPVVVLTDRLDPGSDYEPEGAEGYVPKDHLAFLPSTVRQALEIARLRREKAEHAQALSRALGRSSLLFQENLAGLYVSTPDGRIVECNRAFASILGLDHVEDAYQARAETFYPDPEERRAFVRRVRRDGRIYPPVEVELQRADGETAWILESAVGVQDESGELQEIVGYAIDISQAKRLETQRDTLVDVVEQAAEAVILTDPGGTIIYANQAVEALSGYSRSEVIGQNPSMFKSGKHPPAFYEEMWATLRRGETWSGRLVNRRKDGSRYVADATISGIRDERGDVVMYLAFEKDVTREVELEETLEDARRLEAVGKLAGGVAHDFNNLLTIITASAGLATAKIEDGEGGVGEELTEIQVAARRGAALVENLLAFGRRQIIHPENVDPNEVVQEVAALLGRVIREDIQVEVELDQDVSPLFVDPAQLQSVLLNLCINARDAMPGGGRLTLRSENVTLDARSASGSPGLEPGDYVMLSVTDTGQGMDGALLEQIFDPFFTTKERGTGMGLASVYSAVSQEGGSIQADSEPGTGSTFTIYLPAGKGPKAASRGREPKAAGVPDVGLRILLVEDDAAVGRATTRMLEALGHTVTRYAAPGPLLELNDAELGNTDLVITDLMLPGMHGMEMVGRLRERHPDFPALFISGHASPSGYPGGTLREEAVFLGKPFELHELRDRIAVALGG